MPGVATRTARQGGGCIALWLMILALLYIALLAATCWTLWLLLAGSFTAYPVGFLTAAGWVATGTLVEWLYQQRPA